MSEESQFIWVLYCGVLRCTQRKSYEKQRLRHSKMCPGFDAASWDRIAFESEVEALQHMCNVAETKVALAKSALKASLKRQKLLQGRLAEAKRESL